MTIINSFITTGEIAADLNITRQRVHEIIKEYDLDFAKIGTMLLVDKSDYNKYAKLRKRRDLLTAAGRSEIKFIRSAIHDTVCTMCGFFAVNWEGTIACEQGHIYSREKGHE